MTSNAKCHTYLYKSKFLFMPPAWWMQIVTCLRLFVPEVDTEIPSVGHKNVANRLQHLSPNHLHLQSKITKDLQQVLGRLSKLGDNKHLPNYP